MGVVEHTIRRPSYKSDIKKYGSGGEDVFLKLEGKSIEDKGYKIFNVTDVLEYQYCDIDFIISTDSSIDVLPPIEVVLSSSSFKKVEVKVDTRAFDTGNLPYEYISHGSSGWSVLTKADYIYMILCDESSDDVIAKVSMWIDMNKWHEFVSDRRIKKKINHIRNEDIVDLLCRINDMREKRVIISEKRINEIV